MLIAQRVASKVFTVFVFMSAVISGCSPARPTPIIVTATAGANAELPSVRAVSLDREELPRYESLEMIVELTAEYANPFDVREVSLDAVFTGPNGETMNVPGFWDGKEAWKVRFTPASVGQWTYAISVQDARGRGDAYLGAFAVTPSDLHGWIIPGKSYDPSYSGRYLVHHDGTPFYGIGHCEPLNILVEGFDVEDGVRLFDSMKLAGEYYVVWWPLFSNSFVGERYDKYSAPNMATIDLVVKDAQKEGIFLVFTIWDHPNLRDETHDWNDGRWSLNGFSKLSDIDSFFTSEEAWAWQANMYRYSIARWGYSPAIGMWLTVSEINGTNAYGNTDSWHQRVNDYFVENDPYRHPTTASGSGEWDWEAGHLAMDVQQVHLYDWRGGDVIGAAEVSARWTSLMWERTESPNWIGEFGVPDNSKYPELFHHVIWSALASGAALTPAEWNDSGQWSRMTPEMNADLIRLKTFVDELPLAKWNPRAVQVISRDAQVRGWGVAGDAGGLFWVQDFSLQGQPLDTIRTAMPARSGVEIELGNMANETYRITPFDTWQGVFLDAFEVTCTDSTCSFTLPQFVSDMAFKVEKVEK